MKRILSLILAMTLVLTMVPNVMAEENSQIKNVIYMIPDGGGMSPVYLADALKAAGGFDRTVFPNSTDTTDGGLNIMPYLVGSFTTHCADKEVTDSAAAGTTLAGGYKTNYGRLGVDAESMPKATLLEAAQHYGYRTGLVATYEWMNATPAAFATHNTSRSAYAVLSEQMVNQDIDVVLGANFDEAKWGSIGEAERRGYKSISTISDLEAIKSGDKVWGNLIRSFPYDHENTPELPNLAEMTKAAITALDGGDKGFFLMVEGSKVDGGGHQNYALGMVGDILAFDEACRVAIEYAKGRDDTLVVICPDHDTGGMNLPEDMTKAVDMLKAGTNPSGEITWENTGHTARHGGLFIYAPEGTGYPEGITGNDIGTKKAYEENLTDNTAIAPYIAKFMGLDLDAVTKTLFVDVTDKGEYITESGVFRFANSDYAPKANASYAYVGDKTIDLDGQLCLYINGRFYVPQLLLDIMEGKAEAEESTVSPIVHSTLTVEMPSLDIEKWQGTITVANLLGKKPFNGHIRFTYPESFAEMGDIAIPEIPGGGKEVITFDCPEIDISEGGLVFKYKVVDREGNESEYRHKFKPASYAEYTDKPITIDGVVGEDEWGDALTLALDSIESVVDIEGWKGTRDISANLSFMWDEENLYFHGITADEDFYTAPDKFPMRNLDGISLGFFEDADDLYVSGEAVGNLYEQLEMSLIEGNPVVHRTRCQKYITAAKSSPEDEVTVDDNFEIAMVKDGDYITYEMRIAWEKLFGYEFSPDAGEIMGLAVCVTDNDGTGKRGYLAYGSGMGGTRNAANFAKFFLLDTKGRKAKSPDDVTIVVNGAEVVADATPYNHNGRAMVPVRAVAEKLGAEVIWNDDTKTATITLDGTSVSIPTREEDLLEKGGLKFYTIKVGETDVIVDTSAVLKDGRILVPLRIFSAGLGCTVNFDGASNIATITK